MSTWESHKYWSKKLLGNEYAEVHVHMDEPAQELGKLHRLRRHGLFEMIRNTMVWGSGAGAATVLHCYQDRLHTLSRYPSLFGLFHLLVILSVKFIMWLILLPPVWLMHVLLKQVERSKLHKANLVMNRPYVQTVLIWVIILEILACIILLLMIY
jgi:hypothetical protein